MQIIEYFTAENKEHWLDEIGKCEWGGGKFLYELLSGSRLKSVCGETALVFMLVDGEKLVSFCTFAPMDDIQPTELKPWVGFVYTFPGYRGHRYAGRLLDCAECVAAIMGKEYLYISTNHTGLYEKYGYEFYCIAKDINGEDSRVYRKAVGAEDEEKARRMNDGSGFKEAVVRKAKENIDPVAYCGFSCSHCFMGEWCGGCRSVFNCCSYGTLFEGERCPNITCCREKNIDGCYECDELEDCQNGFYVNGNDGAGACKAQAMFIKKYGKGKFFQVRSRLGEMYDCEKTQEVLGNDPTEALKILESFADS